MFTPKHRHKPTCRATCMYVYAETELDAHNFRLSGYAPGGVFVN